MFDFLRKEQKQESITLYKDKKGNQRWIAAYSSNYLDDDYPSDILSAKAHKEYAQAVETKELDYPELWIWHLPGTSIGKADKVFYDEDNGIAMAAGYIYPDKVHIAKNISKMKTELGTSHGMVYAQRAKDNSKVIDKYVTIEISILPLVAAANKMTGFMLVNKENKTMNTEQKEFLKDSGLSDSEIENVENQNRQAAEENSLRERKSMDTETEHVEVEKAETELEVKQEKVEEDKKEEEEEAEKPETKDQSPEPVYVTAEQLEKTVELLVKTVSDRMNEIAETVKQAKVEQAELQKSIDKKTLSPGATFESIIGESIINKSLSKGAEDAAEVREDDPLFSDAPKETPVPDEAGNPLRNIVKSILKL